MDGQTAVVTGASRGIGEAVARRFAAEGAQVVVCARERDELESVADGIADEGGAVEAMRADVRDEFDVERLMERAARESDGGIDAVVACAGVYHGSPGETPLADDAYSAFDDAFRTNARGVFAAVKEALPHLADGARVVVPSGGVAREAESGYGSYAVSKAAAEAVVRQFAAEADPTVGVVDPGAVATDLTGGRGRDPADAADLVYWAVTDAPAEDVDGGVVGLTEFRQATA